MFFIIEEVKETIFKFSKNDCESILDLFWFNIK